jgi:hypothetical protein
MAAVVFMCRTSTPWALLPVRELGCGSVTTCWRVRRVGARGSVRPPPGGAVGRVGHRGAAGLVAGQRGCGQRARCWGGDLVGANPVDRAKAGGKWRVANEAGGMVLSLLLGPANRPDQELLEAVLDDIPPVATPAGGRRRRPGKCHADKADDTRAARSYLTRRASRSASPASGSSHETGWAATAGKRSARSPGCLAAGGCGSATTGVRSGSPRSGCWPAAGCRSTATPTRPPAGPTAPCWPGSPGSSPPGLAGRGRLPGGGLQARQSGWSRRL